MFATTPRAAGCPGRPISTRTGVLGLTRTDDRSNMTTSRGAGTLAAAPPSVARRGGGGPPGRVDRNRVRSGPPGRQPTGALAGRLAPQGGVAYPLEVSETYFQKGFGLKAAVGPVLSLSYASGVVDRLRALGHSARAGDVTLKLARE